MTDGEDGGGGRPAAPRSFAETGPEDEARLSAALRNLQPGLLVVDVDARRTILANDGALEAFDGRPAFDWVEANLLTSPAGIPRTLALDGRLVGFPSTETGPCAWSSAGTSPRRSGASRSRRRARRPRVSAGSSWRSATRLGTR